MPLALFAAYAVLQDVDKTALRSTVTLPGVELRVQFDPNGYRKRRAIVRIQELQPELLKDRSSPKVLFEVAKNLVDAGELISAKEYFQKVVGLLSSKAARTDEESGYWVHSLIEIGKFSEAEVGLASLKLPAQIAYYKADVAFSKAMNQISPEGQSDLVESVRILNSEGNLDKWFKNYEEVKVLGKNAATLGEKDAEAQRLMANILNAESAAKFAQSLAKREPPKVTLISEQSGAYYKEAAKLLPDDPIAQAELFAYRISWESYKNPGVPTAEVIAKLGKDTKQLFSNLEASFDRIASNNPGTDGEIAAEAAGVARVMRGDYDGGIPYLTKAGGLNPTERRIPLLKLDSYLLAGNYAEASAFGAEFLKKTAFPELQVKVAKALELGGKLAQAEGLILDALVQDPFSPTLKLARASFILRDAEGKDLGEASSILNDLALIREELTPDFQEDLMFYRAVFFGLLGEVSEARRLIGDLKKLSPKEQKYEKARLALGK